MSHFAYVSSHQICWKVTNWQSQVKSQVNDLQVQVKSRVILSAFQVKSIHKMGNLSPTRISPYDSSQQVCISGNASSGDRVLSVSVLICLCCTITCFIKHTNSAKLTTWTVALIFMGVLCQCHDTWCEWRDTNTGLNPIAQNRLQLFSFSIIITIPKLSNQL